MKLSRLSVLIALGTLGVLVLSAAARGHTNEGNDWYFWGSTYKGDPPPNESKRLDPVNIIFYKGGGLVEKSDVGAHITDDWRYGTMKSRICQTAQRMYWRELRGQRTSDRQDMHRMTTCLRQYHTRLWDDWEHSKITNHSRYQWMVGGIHHERVKGKLNCSWPSLNTPVCTFAGTHKIDRDWDKVRVEAVKAMDRHCTTRHWKYHPGAHRTYQGYTNSGWIARISMRHVSAGCGGA